MLLPAPHEEAGEDQDRRKDAEVDLGLAVRRERRQPPQGHVRRGAQDACQVGAERLDLR